VEKGLLDDTTMHDDHIRMEDMDKKSEFDEKTEFSHDDFKHKEDKKRDIGQAKVIDNCFVANFKKF
jgi:hypothetical protein